MAEDTLGEGEGRRWVRGSISEHVMNTWGRGLRLTCARPGSKSVTSVPGPVSCMTP